MTDAAHDPPPALSEPAGPAPRTRRRPELTSRRGRLFLDLVWTIVRTDFKARYHGTVGGFVWALLKPLTMFLSLLAIFSFVFSTEPNYRINLLIGLFLWEFFSESTRIGVVSLAQKAFLLTKARFPGWIVVVTSVSNPLITLVVLSTAILTYLVLYDRLPGALNLALFALYLALFVLMVIGISLGTSALFLRYRDLNQVWDVVSQAGFFITPIIWPIGAIPERYHLYLYLWPPTPFVEFTRQVLVAGAPPSSKATTLLAAETLIVLVLGLFLYRRLAPRSAEYL